MLTDSQSIAGLTPTVTLTNQYDANGNRTQVAANIGGAVVDGVVTGGTADFLNGYQYDALNRETQVSQSGVSGGDDVDPKLATFGYDLDGETTSISRYDDLGATDPISASTYTYDGSGRVIELSQSDAKGGGTYADYKWTYDADNEALSFANPDNANEDVASYSYNSAGELIAATPAGGSGNANLSNSLADSYDANGNATGVNAGGTGTVSQTVGAGNTLLSDGVNSDTYDANGNLIEQVNSTTQTETTYQYDNRNRLTNVTYYTLASGQPVETRQIGYTYDMFNNLIGRTVTGGTNPGTQRYVFDGKNPVLAFDGANPQNLTDRYLWGPAVDQLLADETYYPTPFQASGWGTPTAGANPTTAGTTLWTLGDNQNSVRDVVNDTGTDLQHIAYSPFGQQLVFNAQQQAYVPEVAFAFGYTGTYTDTVTLDQLHGVRWYDPASQRWLSQDPAAADINLYRYCGNAPTDGTDPSGMGTVHLVVNPDGSSKWVSDDIGPTVEQQLNEPGGKDEGSTTVYGNHVTPFAEKVRADSAQAGDLKTADGSGILESFCSAALETISASGVGHYDYTKAFPWPGTPLNVELEGGVDVSAEKATEEDGKKAVVVDFTIYARAAVGVGHVVKWNMPRPTAPTKPSKAMNGDKKAWWRRVSQAYSKQTKEWKENKAGIQKEQGGKTWYGGLELSHDDPKGEPLGFHGSLTLGAHVEGKICYIFGFEADAGWVWNWTGKNGWEKGKLFGKATPVKAVGGEVGAEANVHGEVRGGYKFAVLECPSTGKDNMATKGGSE